jgi:hypothetical protein
MSPLDALGSLVTRPVAQLLALLVVAALVLFADARARVGWFPVGKVVKGAAHAALQLIAVLLSIACANAFVAWLLQLESGTAPTAAKSGWALFLMAVMVVIFGGFLGGLVMGLYLWLANLLGAHGNDAFAALHMTGCKNFLRMRIDGDGKLSIYAIGIDKVCKRWIEPTEPQSSQRVPADPLVTHIIEEVSMPHG